MEKNIKEITTGLVVVISQLLGQLMHIGIYVVHLWTCYLAFKNETIGVAMFTFFTPLLSDIYWVRRLWYINFQYRNLAIIEGALLIFGLIFICISYFIFDFKKDKGV